MDRLSAFLKSKQGKLFTIKNNFKTSYISEVKIFNTTSENSRGLANP